MAGLKLRQYIVLSQMPATSIFLIVLFAATIIVANDAFVGTQKSHFDNEQQQQLLAQPVPSGENNNSNQNNYSDNELLPWYVDFLKLPPEGKLLLSIANFY